MKPYKIPSLNKTILFGKGKSLQNSRKISQLKGQRQGKTKNFRYNLVLKLYSIWTIKPYSLILQKQCQISMQQFVCIVSLMFMFWKIKFKKKKHLSRDNMVFRFYLKFDILIAFIVLRNSWKFQLDTFFRLVFAAVFVHGQILYKKCTAPPRFHENLLFKKHTKIAITNEAEELFQ